MTPTTDEGRKLAAELANAAGSVGEFDQCNVTHSPLGLALARLATNYLNLKADMDQIYHLALANGWYNGVKTLSYYRVYDIAKSHQSAEDLLATEARKLAADGGWNADGEDMPMVKFALRALKRGLEMAKDQDNLPKEPT